MALIGKRGFKSDRVSPAMITYIVQRLVAKPARTALEVLRFAELVAGFLSARAARRR